MSIAIDTRQQQSPFGAGAFAPSDHPQMRFYTTTSTPQFTNPWQQQTSQSPTAFANAGAGSVAQGEDAAIAPGHTRSLSQHQQQQQTQLGQQQNVSAAYQQQPAPAMSAMPSGTFLSAGSFSHNLPQVDSPLQGFMANPMARYSTDLGASNNNGNNASLFGQLPMKQDMENVYGGQPQIRSNSFVSLAVRRASHPSVPPAAVMASGSPAAAVAAVAVPSSSSVCSSPEDDSLMNFVTAAAAAPVMAAPARHHHHQKNSSSLDFLYSFQNTSEAERSSFSDALDASRGMVAMSQDITPRNIFDVRGSRASTDSYGFPSTHSSHSSFSSSSGYPIYYGSSVSEASYGDYSSAPESVSGRSSYSHNSYMGNNHMAAGPATMMGHFSSKVNSSSQKKHKCKICDKRFTRPSSLQTHMYSHTGEKPFACDVEGCGRQFSVVSNLRRHRKVHRGENEQESGNYSNEDD